MTRIATRADLFHDESDSVRQERLVRLVPPHGVTRARLARITLPHTVPTGYGRRGLTDLGGVVGMAGTMIKAAFPIRPNQDAASAAHIQLSTNRILSTLFYGRYP